MRAPTDLQRGSLLRAHSHSSIGITGIASNSPLRDSSPKFCRYVFRRNRPAFCLNPISPITLFGSDTGNA